jgi:hypothetical protein
VGVVDSIRVGEREGDVEKIVVVRGVFVVVVVSSKVDMNDGSFEGSEEDGLEVGSKDGCGVSGLKLGSDEIGYKDGDSVVVVKGALV